MSDDLSVRIGADTSGLQRGLRDSEQGLSKLSRSAMPAIKAIAAVGAAAAGAATAVALFTRAGMNAIDEQAKLARQLDSTIGGLRGLQLAGEDAGVATGTLNSAMQRLSARLGEAQSGTGAAADALRDLGLSARDLAGMDVDRRMATIADRVQELGLSGAQTANVLRDLGIRNTEMVNLLRQGGGAIRDARQEIEDYGLAIDSVDSAAIEAANDALSRVGLVVESIRAQLAQQLAPWVLVVAQRFNEAAREAGGWGSVVGDAVEFSINALGKVLDAMERVRRGFLAAGQGAALFALTVNRWMAEAERSIRTQPLQALVDLVDGLKELPGVGRLIGGSPLDVFSRTLLAQSESSQQDINVLRGAVDEAMADMRDTMNAPMPSTWLDSLREDVAAARDAFKDGDDGGSIIPGFDPEELGVGSGATSEQQEEELERLREHLERRLEVLREGLMDEAELETHHFLDKMEELHEMREAELIGKEEHDRMMLGLTEQHQDRLNAIEKRAADERIRIQEAEAQARQNVVDGMMSNMVSLMNSGSRAMFNIGKVAAVAQALLAGREAIVSSYAAGSRIGGPPLGAAYAATAAAATAAQIASVRSTSFGGGGTTGGSTGGGGTSALAQQPQQPQQPQQQDSPAGGTLTVEGISAGALFSGDAVKELAEELLQYQRRGGEIVIT